jgi:hypothetical protein
MGEKLSPLGEDLSMLAVWITIGKSSHTVYDLTYHIICGHMATSLFPGGGSISILTLPKRRNLRGQNKANRKSDPMTLPPHQVMEERT